MSDLPEPRPRGGTPALRASDADRHRTAELLQAAGADGRLTVAELDERLDAAYAAVTRDDLQALTLDLVPHDGGAPLPATSASGTTGAVVREGEDGDRWIVAVMSGNERSGRWRIGRRCTAVAVMGGNEIDLTRVEMAGRDVHLTVVDVMGGTEIRVPENVHVRVSKFAFMGGHDVQLGDAEVPPGAPTLHLHMYALMGGGSVRRGRPKRRDRG
ncbi:DUF1707 domain-containing protein [Patulibacter sp. SYSU D01012]|uniref:DUF1707 SHOCT-like domain-containing protein n=1 Tax=Patulibacter sp. SYSU D01012 TaxID=2817381 RepID=UPI001B30FBE2|nr:DUF1707 domain-containing protein [Patulibacter sp. SYSU D01012]